MAQAMPAAATRNLNEDDLDPAAFLQSVRELSAKREREDNERFRKLEQEIEKGRQERLARRAEYARSISPEKRGSDSSKSIRETHNAPRIASDATIIATPSNTTMTSEPPSSRSSAIEEVPDFAGFGSLSKKTSTPSTPTPAQVSRPSPSAAMPSRSGTLKWQQRPQSRPMSMLVRDSSTEGQGAEQIKDSQLTREQIAASLSSRDPSWFRQTSDRGVGNAAFRKSKEDSDSSDLTISGKQGLPGMTRDGHDKSAPMVAPSSPKAEAKPGALNLDKSMSPNRELGGFVESAMMKRSNSINKRAKGPLPSSLEHTSAARALGPLQGSHSMPRLDQPKLEAVDPTDSLVRPLSNVNLAESKPTSGYHSRAKSVTSAYTVNDQSSSQPSSPTKRWSPNKSSWIESALTAKQDSRPSSPSKNSQPTWMSDLAKAKAQRNSSGQSGNKVEAVSAASQPAPSYARQSQPAATRAPVSISASPASSPKELQPDSLQTSPTLTVKPVAVHAALTSPKARPEPSPKPQLGFAGKSTASPKPEISPKPIFDFSRTSSLPIQPQASSETSSKPPTGSNRDSSVSVKPSPSPKPQIDFRSSLKPRAATEPVPQEQPEFLSRFGTLRKTTTERYVAPDVLKSNILKGKAGLTTTNGPQKQAPKDEFKESLLAKKEQWQQEKQDGVVKHAVQPPATPEKPEALTRRELLNRPVASLEKNKVQTPEALRRHQSIRTKETQVTDRTADAKSPTVPETSKLASRFNPGLAELLLRGSPTTGHNQLRPGTTGSVQTDEPTSAQGQLQDLRKGRAKGPKKRKAGTRPNHAAGDDMHALEAAQISPESPVSVASEKNVNIISRTMANSIVPSKPTTMETETLVRTTPTTTATDDVPELKRLSKLASLDATHDDKENNVSDKLDIPALPTPSLKDDEAAMRSAMLLASNGQRSMRNGLGISNGLPVKPTRSSRIVSGQLHEASLNKVLPGMPDATTSRIDIKAALAKLSLQPHGRTMRRTLYKLESSQTLTLVTRRQEYTLHEHRAYLLKHDQIRSNGTIISGVYVWLGRRATADDSKLMQLAAAQMVGGTRSMTLHTIYQGYETDDFLNAIGGILITRAATTSSTYMLCGRKYLGHVVLDEVECRARSLCPAFVYLIRSDAEVFIWKGSACSTEEISATRLAAMDSSDSGNVTEIEEGYETTSFWKVFDSWPMREDITDPEALRKKHCAPEEFNVRLFRIQKQQAKQGFFVNMFSRRPSWTSRPSTPTDNEVKYEAKEISPFTQADLEADGVFVLDCYTRVDMLLGPLSDSRSHTGEAINRYALQFTEEYLDFCTIEEKRALRPEAYVVLSGIPDHIPCVFRHWNSDHSLWGTAALMAGSSTIKAEKLYTET